MEIGDDKIRLSRNLLTAVNFWALQAVYSLAVLLSEVLCEFLLLPSLPLQSHGQIPSGLHLSFCSGVPDLLGLSPYLLPSAWALHPLVQFCSPFVASKRSRNAVIGWHCGPALASCDKICCPVWEFFNACCTRMLQSPCKTSPLTALLFLQCLDS